MIEINLLPEGMRKSEATPPARLAVIIAGVIIAGGLGFVISQFYFVKIPNMKLEIANRTTEIEELKKKEAEIKATIAKIDTIKEKVATLEKLIQSRIRYARLLDRLCDAVPPEGAWFKSFSVTRDTGAGAKPTMGGPSGDRYSINVSGYTMGSNDFDRSQKLTELINSLEQHFRVRDVDTKTGYSSFLGAKFDRPDLKGKSTVKAPKSNEKDEKVKKAIEKISPTECMEFTMTMKFELPPRQL